MAYMLFVIFVTLLIALIIMIIKDSQEIDTKKRIGITISLVIIVGLGGIYTYLQDQDAQNLYELQNAFNRGESLQCKMNDDTLVVQKQDFEITSGIKSLQGKDNSPYKGIKILLESCSK